LFCASTDLSVSISDVPTGYYYFIVEEYRQRWLVGVFALLAALAPLLFLFGRRK
jgi:hypothetical protein